MNTPYVQTTIPPLKKKGRGCLFFFVITLLLLVFFLGVASVAGVYFVVRYTTDDHPAALAPLRTTAQQSEDAKRRIDAFVAGLSQKGAPAVPLMLTEDDLNAIVSTEDAFKDIRDKLRFHINGNTIGGEVSIPLEQFGYPGRFINGEADFHLFIHDGKPFGFIQSFSMNGHRIPDAVFGELSKKNLLENAFDKPKDRELLGRLESIDVQGGLLIVRPKVKND